MIDHCQRNQVGLHVNQRCKNKKLHHWESVDVCSHVTQWSRGDMKPLFWDHGSPSYVFSKGFQSCMGFSMVIYQVVYKHVNRSVHNVSEIQTWKPSSRYKLLINTWLGYHANVQNTVKYGVPEFGGLPWTEQLEKLDLFTLSNSRIRGDLILKYRTLKNDFRIDVSFIFFFYIRTVHTI